MNAIIQGSAADIIRRSMVSWHSRPIARRYPMIAQVHDEIVFEYTELPAPKTLELIKDVFEYGHEFNLRVPLLFDPHVGPSWAAAKDGVDLDMLLEDDLDGE